MPLVYGETRIESMSSTPLLRRGITFMIKAGSADVSNTAASLSLNTNAPSISNSIARIEVIIG